MSDIIKSIKYKSLFEWTRVILTIKVPFKFMFSAVLFSSLFVLQEAMAIEEPKYEIVKSFDVFELRKYSPILVAEVTVSGDRSEASSKGFRLIADFIFGNNSIRGTSSKIDMTVPVIVEQVKIDMTAPVMIQNAGNELSWKIQFVMPSQYTIENLPKPNNEAVQILSIPEKYYAVIKFSGFTGDESVAEKTAYLKSWVAKEKMSPLGVPRLARYNPPWTLPFWRRNEILIEVNPI